MDRSNIGPDGKFYLSTGDNITSANSQRMNSVFGKVLRINRDGTTPTDNPFYDGAGTNTDTIWALGLRNAYRASFDTATGEYWVGDVGGNNAATAYEEIDIVSRGENHGWPNCEGPLGQPKVGAVCPSGTTAPIYSYTHDIAGGCCQNKAVIGGEVYRGNSFPATFRGTYVYADYPTGEFYWLERPASGPVTTGLLKASTLADANPVWIGVSPVDGHIYWLHYGWSNNGQVRRLRYNGTLDSPPTITASSATPSSGPAPLNVQFTGAATDPDGDSLTYSWDFGDGTTSNSPSPSHSYASNGVYSARLTVVGGDDTITAAPIRVTVGAPPVATISSPADLTTFVAGDTFTMTGSATDPDDGVLAESALTWTVVLLHDDHSHPGSSGTGTTFTLPIEATGHGWEGETRYRVDLTAVDSDGLATTTSITLLPQKVTRTIEANIPGVTGAIDQIAEVLPFDLESLVGFEHEVTVPQTVCNAGFVWQWSTWSDGGARTHVAVTPADGAGLTATYAATATSCSPADQIGRWTFDENTGTTAADSSGNANTGTLLNGVAWGAGHSGAGSVHNGASNQHVRVANSASINGVTDRLTLSAWIRPTAPTAVYYQGIVTRQLGSSYGDQWFLDLVGGKPTFSVTTVNGASTATAPNIATANTWVHLTGTYDGTTIRLYVNGTQVATSPATGVVPAATTALIIGGNQNTAAANTAEEQFRGTIDDVVFHRRAFSAGEVATLAGVTTPPTTPPTTTSTTSTTSTTTTPTTSTTSTTSPPTSSTTSTTTSTTTSSTTSTTSPPTSSSSSTSVHVVPSSTTSTPLVPLSTTTTTVPAGPPDGSSAAGHSTTTPVPSPGLITQRHNGSPHPPPDPPPHTATSTPSASPTPPPQHHHHRPHRQRLDPPHVPHRRQLPASSPARSAPLLRPWFLDLVGGSPVSITTVHHPTVTAPNIATANTWVHLTGTYDGTTTPPPP